MDEPVRQPTLEEHLTALNARIILLEKKVEELEKLTHDHGRYHFQDALEKIY